LICCPLCIGGAWGTAAGSEEGLGIFVDLQRQPSGPVTPYRYPATGDDPTENDRDLNALGSACPEVETEQQTGSLWRSDLDEASGVAPSRQNPGVLWVHNDYPGSHPGDADQIYAMDASGAILGTYTISVTPGARDPEDIAVGPGPLNGEDNPAAGHYIYWGDIGDNSNQYVEIRVKRIPEPLVDPELAPVSVTLSAEDGVDVITLRYPTGEHAPYHKDAETLMVDPLNGDIYVVTKRMFPNKVYRAAYPQSSSGTTTMAYVATLPATVGLAWITGGGISPDGRLIIVKSDGVTDRANIWIRATGTDMDEALGHSSCLYPLHAEPQGEAIGFNLDGTGFYTVSEAHHDSEPIWYYPLISEPEDAPTATTGSASSITPSSGTLKGTVNPNGASTTVVFEYGITTDYGDTAAAIQSPLTGTTPQAVSVPCTGLAPNTVYHFRVKADNSAGTGYGSDLMFTTKGAAMPWLLLLCEEER